MHRAMHVPPTLDPVMHIPCKYPGCHNIRETSKRNEWKWVCTEHIHFMPYIQDMLIRMDETNLNADRKRAKAAFKRLEVQYEKDRRR